MIGPAKASGLTSREIAEAIPARRYQPSSTKQPAAAAAAVSEGAGGGSSQKVQERKVFVGSRWQLG